MAEDTEDSKSKLVVGYMPDGRPIYKIRNTADLVALDGGKDRYRNTDPHGVHRPGRPAKKDFVYGGVEAVAARELHVEKMRAARRLATEVRRQVTDELMAKALGQIGGIADTRKLSMLTGLTMSWIARNAERCGLLRWQAVRGRGAEAHRVMWVSLPGVMCTEKGAKLMSTMRA